MLEGATLGLVLAFARLALVHSNHLTGVLRCGYDPMQRRPAWRQAIGDREEQIRRFRRGPTPCGRSFDGMHLAKEICA